jgi:hypothetical protein
MKKYIPFLLLILLQFSLNMIGYSQSTTKKIVDSQEISLSGKWSFQLDLITDQNMRPEARQLLFSLKSYMGKAEFSPVQNVDIQKIVSLYN